MKTASLLALLSLISLAISSPLPSPYDVLQHQNNDDPVGTSTVLHHMLNAEDRVLHIVHPDGTTHSMTLLPTSAIHSTTTGSSLSGSTPEVHVAPHVANVHYNPTSTQQHEFTSYTSHPPFAPAPQPSTNNSTPEPPASSLEQHKALGGPLTPSASLASHNATVTPHEGEEKKPEPAAGGEKKATEEKKPEGEKKPESEKKAEGEKKPEDEKKAEEEKKAEGEKKPDEEKKADEKKHEDDHPNGSFAKRDTIVFPVLSLVGAAVGALFVL